MSAAEDPELGAADELDRASLGRYSDPLDLIWIEVARRCGLRVERSAEVFASWDGAGRLRLARAEDFDPDDSLAQLVLHELCHALVEGPQAFARADWGLNNRDLRDLAREHAAHRVQAALTTAHGLRGFLAPTTEHRAFYDALPEEPLEADAAALDGHLRAVAGPWAEALLEGLLATAALVDITGPHAPSGSLWHVAWEARRALHTSR